MHNYTATLRVPASTVLADSANAGDQTLSADATCHALVPDLTTEVTATDNCSAVTLSQSPEAGTSIGLGDTTVTITALDAAGNPKTCTATVHVVYDTAPLLFNLVRG